MDDVKEFSNELNSLYNVKPPISRAKMTSLTRLALKSLKHYKHVVQSIERFIHKCQAEYKLPGLYVIDSIVRQSRHQYGADKDPFAGRFSRNIAVTFHDLLMCPPQEICKIVRVLNLWQKNNMFSSQIIQPLLDMAANPNSHEVYMAAQKAVQQATGQQPSGLQPAIKSFGDVPLTSDFNSGELNQPVDLMKALSNQLLLPLLANPQLYLQLLQQQLLLQQATNSNPLPELQQPFVPQIDGNLMAQIQALTAALMARIGGSQQQSNQQTSAGLDTTTDSFQSSDFHGEVTSPVFSNKKAGLSDIMSDIEDDKVADQMSISSISTPAINTTDGAFASCTVYSPSGDQMDGGQLVTSSTHLVTSSEPSSKAQLMRDAAQPSSCMPSVHPEISSLKSNNDNCMAVVTKPVNKNEYSLFSPVSPINSVPNSPSEQSGTPVLDEIPSPRFIHNESRAMMDGGEKNDQFVDESSKEQYAHNGGVQLDSTNATEALDELQQTPEEGEILATEVEGCEETVSRPISERHKRKRSKRSKEGKRDRSKIVTSTMMHTHDDVKKNKLRADSSTGRNKKESKTIKREKDLKKKRKRNKERQSDGKANAGRASRRSSSSMAEHTLVVEDEPRRYFVVLDELPAPPHHRDVKKSKRKRSQTPEPMIIHSEAHVSRRDLHTSKEQKLHERHKVEVSDDAVKDKKRRKHSKDDSRKLINISSGIDRPLATHSSLISSNGPASHRRHHRRSISKKEVKHARNKSPRKEYKHKNSYSVDKNHEPQRSIKPKNRIYRTKSVSAEPLPTANRKSKSKEKKSTRKDTSSKRSKQSPVKQRDRSGSIKKIKSRSNGKAENEKDSRRDRSKVTKEKESKRNPVTSSSSSSMSSSDNSREEILKKKKYALPSIRDKHACICSTTLWIGPISRHVKKDELKKELHKYSRPTLIDVVLKQSCVYVAFDTREEAIDLMEAINNTSLCGKTIKVTWAPGSGIKQSKFLSRWDVDAGATFIPWDKLPSNMDAITQGGMLVVSSMPLRSKVISDVNAENKEKEIRVKNLSDGPVISFDLNEDIRNNEVLPEMDRDNGRDADSIKQQISKIEMPQTPFKENKSRETPNRPHDEQSNEANLLIEDLSSIALPPPIICETKALESVTVDAIVVRDDDEEEEGLAPIQIVKDPVGEAIKPVTEDIEGYEFLKESNKIVNANKFSFSIENHNSDEIVKKIQDFDADIDSNGDDKNSEVDDAMQVIENIPPRAEAEKKTTKANKPPEILKGKIKFGVISAFSGWANKQKLSAATSAPVATNHNSEEKPKDDARTLYETLMERINAKSSKATKQTANLRLTYNEEFLKTIKVPSPKPAVAGASKVGDVRKLEDMSEVYDPFENYSDSGNNSPVSKNLPVSSQNIEALKLSTNPMVDSTPQSFIYPQGMGPLQRAPFPPNADNNFIIPPYHQQALPQNNTFGPMTMKNVGPLTTVPMVMPMAIPQHTISPAPIISDFQSQKSLGPLSAPPSFRAQQPAPPRSKLQAPFLHSLGQATPRSLLTSNFTKDMSSDGINSSFRTCVQSFNIPPPALPLNRPPNPLFLNTSNNPNCHSNSSMIPRPNVDSSFVFSQSPSATNSPISSAVVMQSQAPHNASNNLFELHRRCPLLNKPTDEMSSLINQTQADMHSMKLPPNLSPSNPTVQNSLMPRPRDRCSTAVSIPVVSNSSEISPSMVASSQSPNFFPTRDFAANPRIPFHARNTLNNQDYNKEIVNNNDNQWKLPKNDGAMNYVMNSVESKFLQTPAMSQSIEVGISNDFKRSINVNISNELSFNTQRSDQKFHTGGEHVCNIDSVGSSIKQLKNEEEEKSLNSFRDPMVDREKFPTPPGFFNVPPLAAQNTRGSVNSLASPAPRPLLSSVGGREPRVGHQEFSKLLNSPVTFDSFSKNIIPKDNIRLMNNSTLNPNFIQRPATHVNDGLLGPPPPNNFLSINKVNCPPPPSVIPNDFNRNFPPPQLPQQMGMRNVLLPSPVERNPIRNPELRFPPPPLLNPSEFLNSLQPVQANELQYKQSRFGERDFGRRGRSFESESAHHPRKSFDNSRGRKNWYGPENGNRGAPRY